MINTEEFYNYLLSKNIDLFTGVPDSLLKNFCACVTDNSNNKNIIAANEGNSIAIASGYNIATGKYALVYMQNSGLGNTVNPLVSLADEEVYSIPMLLLVGWRGEPNVHDEPQHKKQGKITLSLLECMNIEYKILGENYKEDVDYCFNYMKENSKPIALVVKKGTFSDYKKKESLNNYEMTREEALDIIINSLDEEDFIVSTTGKTSRELFELREKYNMKHANDFLTVGSMGHTSSIALGMSLGTNKNIYCIDGDGSFIMHMGGLGIVAKNANSNYKYILINNGAHESVGGQPTIAFDIDIKKILLGLGFEKVIEVKDKENLKLAINELKNSSKAALIINTKMGSREDLGRPTISPIDNKNNFENKIRGNNESINI